MPQQVKLGLRSAKPWRWASCLHLGPSRRFPPTAALPPTSEGDPWEPRGISWGGPRVTCQRGPIYTLPAAEFSRYTCPPARMRLLLLLLMLHCAMLSQMYFDTRRLFLVFLDFHIFDNLRIFDLLNVFTISPSSYGLTYFLLTYRFSIRFRFPLFFGMLE